MTNQRHECWKWWWAVGVVLSASVALGAPLKTVQEGANSLLTVTCVDHNASAIAPRSILLWVNNDISPSDANYSALHGPFECCSGSANGDCTTDTANCPTTGSTMTFVLPPQANKIVDDTLPTEDHVATGVCLYPETCWPQPTPNATPVQTPCRYGPGEAVWAVKNLHIVVGGASPAPSPAPTPTP